MNRPLLIIVARNRVYAESLFGFCELFLPRRDLVHEVRLLTFTCGAVLLDELDKLEPAQLRETMILFDPGPETGAWNAANLRDDNGLATQLVLSYPEVYFAFLGASPDSRQLENFSSEARQVARNHHFVSPEQLIELLPLVQQHAHGFRTLFDPTGLRSVLMQEVAHATARGSEPAIAGVAAVPSPEIYSPLWESRCTNVAVAQDEELPFVYLNGYAAYKAGFRCWTISTKAEFKRLVGEDRATPDSTNNTRQAGPEKFTALLSDWDLVFPDDEEGLSTYSGDPRESLLETDQCHFLPEERLILITGYKSTSQENILRQQNGFTVLKPYGGLFELLRKRKSIRNVISDNYTSLWQLIEKVSHVNGANRRGGIAVKRHSAPYSKLSIASRLLGRAKRVMAGNVNDTEDWVQCAMLAGQANELLGGMSRTTAYEAIGLQNEAEVLAEVSFFGISAELSADDRLGQLERETQIITAKSNTYQPRRQDVALSNCRLQTSNNLRMRFIEFEQVIAAEQCLRKVAKYQRELKAWWNPARWCEWYLDIATSAGTRVGHVFGASVAWIAVFAVIYTVLLGWHPARQTSWCANLSDATWHAASTFVQMEPAIEEVHSLTNRKSPPDRSTAAGQEAAESNENRFQPPSARWVHIYRLVVLGEMAIAVLHLGLLTSVLYRRITRHAP